MSNWLKTLPWIALALALSGCGAKVAIDGETTTGPTPETFHALLSTKMVPNGLCAADADQNQPGAVFLYVAGRPITCEEPDLSSPDCPTDTQPISTLWEICIPIQPELAPKALDFNSYGGYANYFTSGPNCTSEWGFLQQGSITITSVDPSTVTFTLSGTSQTSPHIPMASDGTYEAPRCP